MRTLMRIKGFIAVAVALYVGSLVYFGGFEPVTGWVLTAANVVVVGICLSSVVWATLFKHFDASRQPILSAAVYAATVLAVALAL